MRAGVSRVPSPRICRSSSRRGSNWSSISRLPRRWVGDPAIDSRPRRRGDRMRRREFATLGVAAAALLAFPKPSHPSNRRSCRGSAGSGTGDRPDPQRRSGFRQGLKEFGYVDGQNVIVDTALPKAIPTASRPRGRVGAIAAGRAGRDRDAVTMRSRMRPRRSRSCYCRVIRWERASLPASRGRAATSPACR